MQFITSKGSFFSARMKISYPSRFTKNSGVSTVPLASEIGIYNRGFLQSQHFLPCAEDPAIASANPLYRMAIGMRLNALPLVEAYFDKSCDRVYL